MARSTKTKHVLDLVGAEPVKKTAHPPKPVAAEKAEKALPDFEVKISEPAEEAPVEAEALLQAEAEVQEEEAEVQQEYEAPPETKPEPVQDKPRITAVVCELINQELLSVSERFNLKLTDSNLWELTRAALQDVRPEFAVGSEDLNEKLERLRPKVITAMTKAAIKLSAGGRK